MKSQTTLTAQKSNIQQPGLQNETLSPKSQPNITQWITDAIVSLGISMRLHSEGSCRHQVKRDAPYSRDDGAWGQGLWSAFGVCPSVFRFCLTRGLLAVLLWHPKCLLCAVVHCKCVTRLFIFNRDSQWRDQNWELQKRVPNSIGTG